jgi:hypothetical protein
MLRAHRAIILRHRCPRHKPRFHLHSLRCCDAANPPGPPLHRRASKHGSSSGGAERESGPPPRTDQHPGYPPIFVHAGTKRQPRTDAAGGATCGSLLRPLRTPQTCSTTSTNSS